MTEEGKRRLQQYLRDERDRGATWEELGPTVRAYIERGIPSGPYAKTLLMIDGLKRWKPGSARAVLDGGEPTPDEAAPVAEREQVRLKALGVQLRDVADQLVRELERLE